MSDSTIKLLNEAEFLSNQTSYRDHALRTVKFSSYAVPITENGITSVSIPSLNGKKYEVWGSQSKPDVIIDKEHDISARKIAGLMYSTVQSAELNDFGLEKSGYNAYKRLFNFLSKYRDQKLLRLWNYIPGILDDNHDLERYRQFNIGRFNAWESFGPKDAKDRAIYPAATGIGALSGPVIVECLTTQYPVHYLQNPRQTPSHLYSKKYGPLPPVFARASLHLPPSGPELYISGTASLVGENAIWLDDPRKQAQETLKNIGILIGDDNLEQYNVPGFKFKDLQGIRVYIKNQKHLEVIKSEVEKYLPSEQIIYLHDDICRPEWLLEIEAVAKKSK